MLFTIGYSAFQIKDFVDVLKRYSINLIIDVRSFPYSEYHKQYNKENIERILKTNNIRYRNYSEEFGARQTEKQFFSSEGYLNFELYTKSAKFGQGVEKINVSLEKGFCVALMCAEKDPATCHRSIMISRAFCENGNAVMHILANGYTESQTDIELMLLDKYFPNRNQLTLFEEQSDEQLIAMAYQQRNAEIGYRLKGNEK
jgi:uncharacterized protein (DUF488 family)